MKIVKTEINFQDERGIIRDLIVGEVIDSVTFITTKREGVRGNHYHKKTKQYDYIMEGSFLCRSRIGSGDKIEENIVRTGDVVIFEPGESHAYKALEDASFLSCTSGPRRGKDFEKDTYRLSGNDVLI